MVSRSKGVNGASESDIGAHSLDVLVHGSRPAPAQFGYRCLPCGVGALNQHVIPAVGDVALLDSSSRLENLRPPDAQFCPFDGVLGRRAPLGVGATGVLRFIEQLGE